MKQTQFYRYAALALLILNIAILAFFFLHKPPHAGSKKGRGKLAHELMNLSDQQFTTFKNSAEVHMNFMSEFNLKHNDLLAVYFQNILNQNEDISVKDSLMTAVLASEKKKIEATYNHFKEIKELLEPEQLASFEKFIEELIQSSSAKPRKK